MLTLTLWRSLKNHSTATPRLSVSVGRFRIEGTTRQTRTTRGAICSALFAQQTSPLVLESHFALLEDCYDQYVRAKPSPQSHFELAGARRR